MVEIKESNSYKNNVSEFIFKYGVIIALVLLVLLFSFLSNGTFLKSDNLINVFQQVSVNTILAIGLTFVILTAGIDLSVGSIVAFAGIIATSFVTGDENNLLLAIVFGLGTGLLLGFLNGVFIAKFKLQPFIATLGMMAIARGATYIYSDGVPIGNLQPSYLFIGGGRILGIPFPIYVVALVAIIFFITLNKTKFGRYVFAVGGNERAALISGINVNKVKIIVYSISGLLAGLAGIIISSRVTAGLPQAGMSFELDAIAAVVIGGTSLMGGRGRLWGTIIGALILGVLNNGMDIVGVSSYWKEALKGCIIIAAVMLDRK